MKNYKFNILICSVLLIGLVFITSCHHQALIDENTLSNELLETDNIKTATEVYTLPKGLEKNTPEYIVSYVEDLSDDERGKLSENYRVQMFLELENLYESAYNQLNEGELFTNSNLNDILTSEQMQHLNDFSLDDLALLRDCYTTPNYPMYKCHDPEWCGGKKHIATNCYSGNWYCGSSRAGETVEQQYCGYPHGVLVRWHLYTCHNACP